MPARNHLPRSQMKTVRVPLHLRLTKSESKQLEAQAAADLRSMGSYIGQVIIADLARKHSRGKPTKAKPEDKRVEYAVGPMITIPEREKLLQRVAAERRSLSSYVTRLVLEALA
jgi:hypothetical protein